FWSHGAARGSSMPSPGARQQLNATEFVAQAERRYAVFLTRPERRQRVQTSSRLAPAPTRACTRWRFGRHTRLDLLFAWLTLWPTDRCLPQTSQARAMGEGA